MPRYIVTSEGPISVRPLERPELPEFPERPTDPGWGVEGPAKPGHGLPIHLPPRDEWPPLPELPDGLPGKPVFPIPPTPEFPMVPVEPETAPGQLPVFPPGMVWPPIRPEWPDKPEFGHKALALAFVYIDGHAPRLRWVVVDLDAIPHPPAGGIAGRPPSVPGRP